MSMEISVLVVDDDAAFRALALRLLRFSGFAVVGEADTSAGGMAAALALCPDAMLVDVRLPDGSGIDLARALAKLAGTPRVVLTSSDLDVELEISAGDDSPPLLFVPKDELPNAPLARLLAR
jgi:DNA-binding NarL/FixJ family response regulator